jgi:hypothetical protein
MGFLVPAFAGFVAQGRRYGTMRCDVIMYKHTITISLEVQPLSISLDNGPVDVVRDKWEKS